MAGEAGYDRYISVFSPEGRLYQIEYAFKRVKLSNLTSVAMKGEDAVVLLSQKKVPDKLIDPASVTNVYQITEHIGAVMTGIAPDARALVQRARQLAAEFEYEHGYEIPASYLARKVADECQVPTQQAFKRMQACVMMLGGVDAEAGPQLFRIDPAGHFLGYKACAAGVKEQEATNNFEKKIKAGPDQSAAGVARATIDTLQTVLGADFKGDDVEAVELTAEGFRRIPVAEVEAHLTAIAEED